MTNRRTFLQGSMAASLLTLSPALLAAVESLDVSRSRPLYKLLFDVRSDASRRIADRFAADGVATYELRDGDVTHFWRSELAAVWAQAPVPVAGATDASVLFCLEQLGRQYGLRVIHRESHESGLVLWIVAPRHV